MEIKINFPLIDKISSIFLKSVPPVKKREETTETSLESLVASYYYKKIKLERTKLAKYGDYLIMDDKYPEILTTVRGEFVIPAQVGIQKTILDSMSSTE